MGEAMTGGHCLTADDVAEFMLARTIAIRNCLRNDRALAALAHQGALLVAKELIEVCPDCDCSNRALSEEIVCPIADDYQFLAKRLSEETRWANEVLAGYRPLR
jgi:hypothetical protein